MFESGRTLRVGIAAKIFGGMFLLVVLMASTAVASMMLVRQVTDELTIVEGAYLPIAYTVTSVELAALQQELQFERVLATLQRIRSEELDSAVAAYLDLGVRVDTEIEGALALLRETAGNTGDVDHRVALTRLEQMLVRLEQEHQDVQDHGLEIVELVEAGSLELAELLTPRREREQAEFDEAAHAASEAASELAAAATASAVARERQVLRINVVLTALAAALALLLSILIVRGLTRPVRDLLAATLQIRGGNLEVDVPVESRDEIGDLAASFNHMAGELREKEQIKDTFGRYIDPRIVENLLDQADGRMVTGESADFTVYFSDIAGFTSISEQLTPSGLVNLINAYLTVMSVPVRESKGIIDKYIGDAIMAYWGPPFTAANEHARLACGAALLQQVVLEEFQTRVPELTGLRRNFPLIRARIGVATGEVVVGSIGSDVSRNYTVMGDTVNLASRLEGLNKAYGTRILVSEKTRRDARADFVFREVDTVTVVGKVELARIFELMATTQDASPAQLEFRDTFQHALEVYRTRAWDDAEEGFRTCIQMVPDDGPSGVYLNRIQTFRQSPPPPDWDGHWDARSKTAL